MFARIIIFLLRKKLGVKKNQFFRFTNQKKDAFYWFDSKSLMRYENSTTGLSDVGLNWLLDKNCKVMTLSDTFVTNIMLEDAGCGIRLEEIN